MSSKYDDIIFLPHPVSSKHPQMSIHDRAAQFAPFAALNGFEESIDETSNKQSKRSGDLGEGFYREEFVDDI